MAATLILPPSCPRSYTSPDGTPVAISFTAGAGGYQPEGDVLPVSVPLPYQRSQTFDH